MNWFPEDLVSAYADSLLAEEPDPPRTVSLGRLLRANVYLALVLLAFPAAIAVVAILFSGGRSPLPFVGVALLSSVLFAAALGQGVYTARDALQRGVAAAGQVTRVEPGYRGSRFVTVRVEVSGEATNTRVGRSGASSELFVGDIVRVLIDPQSHNVLLITGVLQPVANPVEPAWVNSGNRVMAVVSLVFGTIGVVAAIGVAILYMLVSGEVDAHNAATSCAAPSEALSVSNCRWVGEAQVVRKYEDQNSRPFVDLSFDDLPGYVFTADFGKGQDADLYMVQQGGSTTAELWHGMVIEVAGVRTGNDYLLVQTRDGALALAAFFGVLGLVLVVAGAVYGRRAWAWGRPAVRPLAPTPGPTAL